MSTTNPRRENGTDDDAPFQTRPTATVLLGTDVEGDDHVLDRATGRVHQLDAATGDRLHVHDLTARPEAAPVALEIYVHDFIGGQRGWADRQWLDGRDLFGETAHAGLDRGERVATDGGEIETREQIHSGVSITTKLKRGSGLIVRTPDGSAQHRIFVDNAGNVSSEQL